MATPFEQAIQAIYQAHPHHYFPHIGARYLDPDPTALRVLVLGINPYVDDIHWGPEGPDPSWYATWYKDATWRYQKRVRRSVATLVKGLVEPGVSSTVATSKALSRPTRRTPSRSGCQPRRGSGPTSSALLSSTCTGSSGTGSYR